MLTFKVGDLITNKTGDNTGEILAIFSGGGAFKRHTEPPASHCVVCIRWNIRNPSADSISAITWYSVADIEKVGWQKKLEPIKAIPCPSCGDAVAHECYFNK